MKTTYRLLFFTFLFLTTSINAQKYFEGIITYDLEFKDKTGQMSDQESKQYIGDMQTYYIKDRKYKAETNGLLKMTLFYVDTDTLFTKMSVSESLMYVRADEEEGKVISHSIKKNVIKISGYTCHLLEVKTTTGSIKYYYSEDIKINPSNFKNHKQGYWYFCLTKTNGAIPLKSIQSSKEEKITVTANAIVKKKLDASIFELPKNLPRVKPPK